jgi:SLBB domain
MGNPGWNPPTMKLLSVLALLLLPAAIIPAQIHSGAPPDDSDTRNLFTNGDFEKGAAGWELLNWGKDGRMEMDPNELHNGKPSLRVDNAQNCHSFIRQIVMGKPYTRYRFSGYIKTRDVESEPNGQKSGAVLMVGRMAAYTPLLAGTTPWTAVSVDFATKDDPEIRLGPSLGTDPTFPTGTAWFSGLRLIELGGVDEIIPVPERAKNFLDPVETLLRAAPGDALQKLKDSSTAPEAAAELNRYFANHALNKSIVLHTTVEAAQAQPDVRNGFRIGAASTPLALDGVTLKRLSWLYFQQSHSAEANSVKVGSDITVTGWIRRCEVVMTPDGPRLNFDLQHTRIIAASLPLPAPGELSFNGAAKPATASASSGDLNRAPAGQCTVTGEVRRPGPQPINTGETLTLQSVILRAGGFNEWADTRRVRLTRRNEVGEFETLTFNLKAIIEKNSDDPIIRDGDRILVPKFFHHL